MQQYNKSLRCIPDRRSREDGSSDRYFGGRSVGPWRSGGSGSTEALEGRVTGVTLVVLGVMAQLGGRK